MGGINHLLNLSFWDDGLIFVHKNTTLSRNHHACLSCRPNKSCQVFCFQTVSFGLTHSALLRLLLCG